MKKGIGLWMIFLSFQSLACDICNMSVSLTPNDNKNTFSLLYRHRLTDITFIKLMFYVDNQNVSRHSGVKLTSVMEDQYYTETFSVYEARCKYNFTEKFNVFVSLPVINNERTINGESKFNVIGIGDPIVLARYHIVKTKYLENSKTNHRITLGAGFKIPLGKYDFEKDGETVEHDIQTGTGTLDFVFSLDYIFKYKKVGFATNANYKANTKNYKVDYMFGNTFNSTLSLFYIYKVNDKISIMPTVGSYYEYAGKDIEYKKYEENSGGEIIFGSAGLNVFFHKMRIEATYQHALNNKLNGKLQLETKNRIQVGVSYLF